MITDEIENSIKQQEDLYSKANVKLCEQIKYENEEKYASFILRKEIIPYTKWFLEDLKDSAKKIELNVGDQILIIDLEQSFSIDNIFHGTTRNRIIELGSKAITVVTPNSYNLLIGEGYKVFAINKPLYENEFGQQELKNQSATIKILAGLLISIILVLIILGFMVL